MTVRIQSRSHFRTSMVLAGLTILGVQYITIEERSADGSCLGSLEPSLIQSVVQLGKTAGGDLAQTMGTSVLQSEVQMGRFTSKPAQVPGSGSGRSIQQGIDVFRGLAKVADAMKGSLEQIDAVAEAVSRSHTAPEDALKDLSKAAEAMKDPLEKMSVAATAATSKALLDMSCKELQDGIGALKGLAAPLSAVKVPLDQVAKSGTNVKQGTEAVKSLTSAVEAVKAPLQKLSDAADAAANIPLEDQAGCDKFQKSLDALKDLGTVTQKMQGLLDKIGTDAEAAEA